MKKTLAEIKMLIENKTDELSDIYKLRDQVKLNVYRKPKAAKDFKYQEEYLAHPEHEFKVDDLTKKAVGLEKEIRKLKIALGKGNQEKMLSFKIDGEPINLQEGILYLKQLRNSLPTIKYLGNMKETRELKEPRSRLIENNIADSYEEIDRPTFNTKEFRSIYKQRQNIITALELEVSTTSLQVEVEIPDYIVVDEE